MGTAIEVNSPANGWPFFEASTRVLVVDDQKEMRDHLCEMLKKAGCEVIAVGSGEEAIKVCRSERISVIVLDIFMPGKDGFETIIDLRRSSPEAKLIAMTGRLERRGLDVLKWAGKLGARATLTKPFTPDELLRTVAQVLSLPLKQSAVASKLAYP